MRRTAAADAAGIAGDVIAARQLAFDDGRRVGGVIGGAALPHPEADAERLVAPNGRVAAPDQFAGGDQGGGSLELLQGEQAQGVAHQHRHPFVAEMVLPPLQPPDAHGEGGHAQVRLCFAAAGGEPEQIYQVAPFGVGGVGEGGDVEQDEGQLKRPPTTRRRFINVVQGGAFALADGAGVDGVDALLAHGLISEAEGLRRLRVAVQQGDAGRHAGQGGAAFGQIVPRPVEEGAQVGRGLVQAGGLGRNPGAVGV